MKARKRTNQSQCTFPRFVIGLVLPLLLPTPTIWFSVDHKRNVSNGVVSGIGTLFSLDHKASATLLITTPTLSLTKTNLFPNWNLWGEFCVFYGQKKPSIVRIIINLTVGGRGHFQGLRVLALYLSSFMLTPEMNSNSKRNFLPLTSVHALPSETCISSRCSSRWIYIRFSVFFCFLFSQTCPGTSTHHLNFMLVTELKHCENNTIAKHQGTTFLHFQCLFELSKLR